MQFLKENSSRVTRLVITHIAMSIFGLVLFGVTNRMGAPTQPGEQIQQFASPMMLVASILSVVFYAVIVYTTMWEYGAKDKAAFDAGRKQKAWKCGFLVSVLAESFWLLLSLFSLFGFFGVSASGVGYTILILTHSCFTGIETYVRILWGVEGNARFWFAFLYIFGSFLISAVSALGYTLGTKEIRIIPKKNTEKK